MPAKRICLAEVATPHGVRGALKVRTFTAAAEDLLAYGPLQDEAGRPVELRIEGITKAGVIARIAGIEDRDQAEAWRRRRLYVARDALPPPEDADEFYISDLIGLEAVDRAGMPLGTIEAVQNYGAGDLVELVRPDGSRELLPFTREVVPAVDLETGRAVIAPPPAVDGREPAP